MSDPLWTWGELEQALGAAPDGATDGAGASGVSIDTRTLEPGDIYVAIKGDVHDGHKFVANAFAAGASCAIVNRDYQPEGEAGPLFRVQDPLRAMEALGRAARARSKARIIAVTGSVGKTGVKEMLRVALDPSGAVHASEKSYNNHWGVPLTLARLPRDADFGVFEIGMNHPGEITPLVGMVQPHIAIVTAVAPAHLGHFSSVEEIARAKAEIFSGLAPGGAAVINLDHEYHDLLRERARRDGADAIVGYGQDDLANSRAVAMSPMENGSKVEALIQGESVAYEIGAAGPHMVQNSLGVLTIAQLAGASLKAAARALADFTAAPGRGGRLRLPFKGGEILLIDESYNANPVSMAAAMSTMALTPRAQCKRRIVVLGDMRELGGRSEELHHALAEPIRNYGVDLVFLAGAHMKALHAALPDELRGGHAEAGEDLIAPLLACLQPGDAVMVKGSQASGMGKVAAAMKEALSSDPMPPN